MAKVGYPLAGDRAAIVSAEMLPGLLEGFQKMPGISKAEIRGDEIVVQMDGRMAAGLIDFAIPQAEDTAPKGYSISGEVKPKPA